MTKKKGENDGVHADTKLKIVRPGERARKRKERVDVKCNTTLENDTRGPCDTGSE